MKPESQEQEPPNVVSSRVMNGERAFWIVAAIAGLIFLLYLIGAYRFAEPAWHRMWNKRWQNIGSGR